MSAPPGERARDPVKDAGPRARVEHHHDTGSGTHQELHFPRRTMRMEQATREGDAHLHVEVTFREVLASPILWFTLEWTHCYTTSGPIFGGKVTGRPLPFSCGEGGRARDRQRRGGAVGVGRRQEMVAEQNHADLRHPLHDWRGRAACSSTERWLPQSPKD